MRQKWRELLFLHWPIPTVDLRPLVPPQLDLDLFDGTAYVGLVPFTMKGVRPVGLPPVAGLSRFHETNVRTYVHRAGRDPGVWFFSLEAANPIAVSLARSLYHLPYHHAKMFLERDHSEYPGGSSSILYAGTRIRPRPRPASYLIRACPTGTVEPARQVPSSISSPSVTSSMPWRVIISTSAGSTIIPIPSNRQGSSTSTNRSWPPPASDDPTSRHWPTSPRAWTSRFTLSTTSGEEIRRPSASHRINTKPRANARTVMRVLRRAVLPTRSSAVRRARTMIRSSRFPVRRDSEKPNCA